MTLNELLALPNEELARIAAVEVMGWHDVFKMGSYSYYADSNEILAYYHYKWRPATDRNQSGELLTRMVERGIKPELSLDPRSETVAAILAARAMKEAEGK